MRWVGVLVLFTGGVVASVGLASITSTSLVLAAGAMIPSTIGGAVWTVIGPGFVAGLSWAAPLAVWMEAMVFLAPWPFNVLGYMFGFLIAFAMVAWAGPGEWWERQVLRRLGWRPPDARDE
jgi:hypothetical protein